MATEEELLAAIDANMDDDTPRLAHADWLEANGDPERAEFIRLQVRHARMPFDGAEEESAHERRYALLEKNESRWLGDRPNAKGVVWNFTRGYPDVVGFSTLDVFDKEWPGVFEFPVRWVVFRGIRSPARLAASPGLARFRWLSLDDINETGVLTILRSKHLSQLAALEIHQGRLTAATLAFIATSPKFARLRELTLVGNRVCSAEDFRQFIRSPNLAGLRKLQLFLWGLDAHTIRALWQRSWPALVSLNLTNNPLGPGGLAGLGDGGQLPSLEELSLSVAELGDEGAMAIARAVRLTRLSRLELHHNGIGEMGARALANAPHLSGLATLFLEGNAINDSGAEALAGSSHLGKVRSMDLTENLIGDAGMRALGRSETLTSLRYLYTHGNPARPDLAQQVADRFRNQLPPIPDPDEEAKPPVPVPPGEVVGQVEEDGLVRAILADPWDELARSAYADWLDEQGSPLHAALMRLPPEDRGAGRILEELAPTILGPLPGSDRPALQQEGGLIVVRVPVRAFSNKHFEREGPGWIRRNHVCRIQLTGTTKSWGRIADAPVTRCLRGLCLKGVRLKDEDVKQLADSSGLSDLASFGFTESFLSLSGVQAIARSPHLARIYHLDLTCVPLRMEEMRELCEASIALSLRKLTLTVTSISDACATILAQSPALAGLVTLDLAGNQLRGPGVQALANSPHLAALRNLDLRGNLIGEDGVMALARSPMAARLRRVSLYDTDAWQKSYQALAEAMAPGAQLIVG
jgi:uncharacterized protein (TIGR02996 family)